MAQSPGLTRAIQQWKDVVPPGEPTVDDWRTAFSAMCAKHEIPDGTVIQSVDAGGVPALWVSAAGVQGDRVGIFFHSGGYLMGSAADYREFAARLSAATDSRVLVIDYRLAPEHPYPAALEDAVAAYRWLAAQHDPERTFVCGDSAGGGLSIATLVALRDAGDRLPAAAALISPLTDHGGTGASVDENDGIDPLINRAMIIEMGSVYLNGRKPEETPLSSVVHADVHDLPPLLFQVGRLETLRDDSTRVAEKARAAGGEAEVVIVDDVPHIWPLFPYVPESAEALERIGRFVKDKTASPVG